MVTMKIIDVQRVDKGDSSYWAIILELSDEDGTVHNRAHIMPADTLEWRAAEYGIDPADTATLLDVVLAEPYLSEEDWATGHQLHDAPDIDTARRAHIARCARAKLRHRLSTRTRAATKDTPAVPNPCQRVADESPLHPEAIELKRQLVQQARAAHAQARAAAPPDRIAALRAAVERGQPA
ncbi:hypothetical protein [Amycolatopsis eburnea]|uniref:Uncharacterized protein n=1 Tax=Amycolatopsis eburnea TaxID=2267691 RepID=A0A3R9EUD6_9PSEU|nr:hypothetical protein [Amycolatopsis eburnea]RSD22014.1 hypothetical protein EIY87_09365 [Amycolatopsis eburnea]